MLWYQFMGKIRVEVFFPGVYMKKDYIAKVPSCPLSQPPLGPLEQERDGGCFKGCFRGFSYRFL